ncbi:MAG: DASS family sodium-coupled anion symporter [Cyanobacteriota bacterium]
MENKIYIDKRPLPILFFIEYRKAFIFTGLFILFIKLLTSELPENLPPEGWKALCSFIFCILLWVTDVIPRAITGIIAIVLIPTLGILPKELSYSLFGNQTIFFILGAFMIAVAYSKSGLSKRMAIFVLRSIATTPVKLLLSILLFSAFLSLWMPEHAVAAILFPVVLDFNNYITTSNKKKFSQGMFFALIWGCCIGGVGTFLGGARNPLAVGLLEETTGTTISFLDWMIAIIPFVFVNLMFASLYLTIFFKDDFDLTLIQQKLLEKRKWIGNITIKEYMVGIVILLTILSWITLGDKVGITNIALLSAILLFVLNLVSWEEASSNIHWDILLMYGGALSLGSALDKTGAISWICQNYFSNLNYEPILIVFIFTLLSIFLTEVISNAAVVLLLLPIALNIAISNDINPIIITFCVAVPSGLAFMLPIGNPPNAICFSSKTYTTMDSIKTGLVMNFISIALFMITVIIYWPLIGLKL